MVIPFPEDILVNAVEKIGKSVVNIASVRMLKDQLFRVPPIQGVGSGVIVNEKGHILTNNHVVDDSERLKVTLTDGRVFNGAVVGGDEITDLAVVKVESEVPLPSAKFGDSHDLRVGQVVIAIGNPFGLTGGPAVTAGIISSLNRSIQTDIGVLELIQTDAAINPGNSGGPLANTKGEIVAINTANMPYAQGIGFAVPSNTAKPILKELIERGQVTRPWIGVATIMITPRLVQYYNLPIGEGALIANVEEYSPADKAGLRKGDIIEQVEGNLILDALEISREVQKKQPNEEIMLTINRYGRRFRVRINVEKRPSREVLPRGG